MSQLAGGHASFVGAVESPDAGVNPRSGYGFKFPEANHCMNGDFNIVGAPTYRQTMAQAHANLRKCVRGVTDRMAHAVQLAARLVPNLRADGIPALGCVFFRGRNLLFGTPITPSNPKCAVINELGRGLHTAQDFYAHSNWTDAKLPGQNSVTNPPGLGQTGVPAFLRFTCTFRRIVGFVCPPLTEAFPPGLVTACDEGTTVRFLGIKLGTVPGAPGCKPKTAIAGSIGEAVTHATLEKDRGTINPVTGMATPTKHTSARGRISAGGVTNWQRAVTGAVAQTRGTWSDFIAALRARYGPAQSQLMVRALTCDKPWEPRTCPPSGAPTTGGGSTAGGADPALLGAGGAAVAAGVGLLGLGWRRRGSATRR
jgi:hypothetical protein